MESWDWCDIAGAHRRCNLYNDTRISAMSASRTRNSDWLQQISWPLIRPPVIPGATGGWRQSHLVRQADIADILVSLSRLQLVQSSKNCVRMELLLLIFSMLMVDFAVAARDKSAGSLALLVSDVLTQ